MRPRWTPPTPVTRENYPDAAEIFDAGFPVRVRNCLIRNYVWDLSHAELADRWALLDMRGFGLKSLYAFAIRMRELDRVVDPVIFDWMNEE